jgi:hypothetical protein
VSFVTSFTLADVERDNMATMCDFAGVDVKLLQGAHVKPLALRVNMP